MSQKIDEIGLYQIKGNAGNVGTPGAPAFQFSLLVNAASGAHGEQRACAFDLIGCL